MNMEKFAAQVCGMAQPGRDYQTMPVKKLAITARDTKGMVPYTFTSSEGLELECYLDYEPAEKQTNWEPGCSESIELIYALHKGEDISEVLHDDVKALIEEEALAALHEQDRESCTDAAIERYISRMESQS